MGSWIPFEPSQEKEDQHKNYLAAVGFLFLMCYFFIGIAIASDIFMNAIEKICGATKTVKIVKEEDGVVVITTKQTQVWNETVANLTLMALGSSAPEILLSAIEISGGLGRQSPGDLGPGTIVGSAAYNLMIISAVCILSLPPDATSRIKIYKVFVVTSVTSLLAYIWMLVVLTWWTPDYVTLEEALLTLFYFPLMVALAYWADQNFCTNFSKRRSSVEDDQSTAENPSTAEKSRSFFFGDQDFDNLYNADGSYNKNALMNLYHKLNEVADLKPEQVVQILAAKLIQGKQHTRMWHRMQATRAVLGGGKNIPVLDEKLQEVVNVIKEDPGGKAVRKSILMKKSLTSEILLKKAVVDFQAATLAVSESIGEFQVVILRSGKEDVGFQVKVDTADGSAKKGTEYEELSELVQFDPYVKEQSVTVKVIDNVQWNPDSNFYLRLSIPNEFEDTLTLGKTSAIEIIIEDDDKPGKLSFEKRGYIFKDSLESVYVDVVRDDGTDGVISVTWNVEPGTKCNAVSSELSGNLEFKHGEKKKSIEIPLSSDRTCKVEGQDENFDVVLSDPQGGAKLGKILRTTCAVSNDKNFKLEINNVVDAALQLAEESEEDVTYKDQILQALKVNGGDVENATWKNWIIHIFIFPLKFICCLIPPPGVCGGWLCFIFALLVVGFLTKLVGDTAENFGEALGIDPVITAMTFVALGTSLPDTFASRIAAVNDKTADNAIGNVTGSNSVNVFLGLGVPWTIGAIYYTIKPDKQFGSNKFCVPAGNLTDNVAVFSVCAFVAIAILTFRRYSESCGKAELGGPKLTRWISAVLFIILWLLYIGISSWRATEIAIEVKKNQLNTSAIAMNKTAHKNNCIEIVHYYRHKIHPETK